MPPGNVPNPSVNEHFTAERVAEEREQLLEVLRRPGLCLSERAIALGMPDHARFTHFYQWLDAWPQERADELVDLLVREVEQGQGVVFGWKESPDGEIRIHVGTMLDGPLTPVVVESIHP